MSTWALGPLDPVSDLYELSVATQASPGHGGGPRFDRDANPRRPRTALNSRYRP